MPVATLLSAVLLTPAVGGSGSNAPPPFHARAVINDPMSHGRVGDNLLSLNEAIRLHNNTLLLSRMSVAEQAQVALIPNTGPQMLLSEVWFDAAITPVITIERTLDRIVDTPQGLLLSSLNGQTVLDIPNDGMTGGLYAITNALELRNLVFRGGIQALVVQQSDVGSRLGFVATNCRFERQSWVGIWGGSYHASGVGRAWFEGCVFDSVPHALLWDDIGGAGRTAFVDLRDCRIVGARNAVQLTFGGSGGMAHVTLDRVVVDARGFGLALSRQGSRGVQLRAQYVEARAPFVMQGGPSNPTGLQVRMSQFRRGLQLMGNVAGVLEDSTIDGGALIHAVGGTAPLMLQNVRCTGAHGVAVRTGATQPLMVSDSRFDSCPVAANGLGPVTFTNCCFVQSPLTPGTLNAVACIDCYLPNPDPNVVVASPRPAAQLGSMRVLPDDPTVGSTITLQADLPTGYLGLFLVGVTDPNPTFLPPALHLYCDVNRSSVVPLPVLLQQALLWSIPANPSYRGLDLTAQIAVMPFAFGVIPLQLPPGRRFVLR